MSFKSLNLFQLGQRGVNVVTAPTHLTPDELTKGQNAEVLPATGEGALDQRPGMDKLNPVALNSGAAVLSILDVPSKQLQDQTPSLWAGMYTGATHNWRKSLDGVTWTNVDTLAKPFSNVAGVGFFKNWPKAVTIGGKLYYVDGNAPLAVHQWDGTTDIILSTIPPAVSGVVLSIPAIFPGNANGLAIGYDGGGGATTYSYKFVAISGTSHSAASAVVTYGGGAPALNNPNEVVVLNNAGVGTVPPGASSVDVYRTVGGATQGKVGSIPIVAGAYTTGNGTAGFGTNIFADAGLTADGTTAPTTPSGAAAGNAITVLDMITDGTYIYMAVLDLTTTDPNLPGRILQFNPASSLWSQIGAAFPTVTGNGTAGALAFHTGALNYGTYIGVTSGNTAYENSTGFPLPAGGVAVHTNTAGQAACSLAMFQGNLYLGTSSLSGVLSSLILKRSAIDVWTQMRAGPVAATFNAYTSLYVYNGILFAGWTSGGGATAARIESSPDGTNWTLEATLDVAEVVCQMVTFKGTLYAVLGKTGVGYNTKSRIIVRAPGGTWSTADDPADDFAGCIGVLYT